MKTKRLYTVIVDYKGGTYCSQVMAIDEAYALVEWAQQIESDEVLVAQFTKRGIHNLQKQDWIDEWRPVPLDGLVNVWCGSARVKNEMCLMNVILTRPK